MPATTPAPRKPIDPPRRDALARLYVYWLFSTALLVLLLVIVGVYVRGALARQATRLDVLSHTIDALRNDVTALEARLTIRPAAPSERPPPPPAIPAPSPSPSETQSPPAPTETPPPPPVASDAEITARLAAVLTTSPATPADVRNVPAAQALIDDALAAVNRATWSNNTWEWLAILARLRGYDSAAETFARRATNAGAALTRYNEVTIRSLLARGRARDALSQISRYIEQTTGTPTAVVFVAVASLAAGDETAADRAAGHVPVPADVRPYDRLLLARVLLHLERWERLSQVMASLQGLEPIPAELEREYNFLQAVCLARGGQPQMALAVLDYLAGSQTADDANADKPAPWPTPGPDTYEVEVWRGLALAYAQQPTAAREVLLAAAQRDAARPDAYYWLGWHEFRHGEPRQAVSYLQNALACSARYVAAWELLGLVQLELDQAAAAIEHLTRATELNARRASAHFLLALARAKLSQRDEAATALRAALSLEPGYLAQARQADALRALFSDAEMGAMAGELPAPNTPEPVVPAPPTP